MTTRRRPTWREKPADDKDLLKVIEITGKLNPKYPGGGPAPEADAESLPEIGRRMTGRRMTGRQIGSP